MSIKTQKTMLYCIDGSSVLTIACIISLNGLSSSTNQLDDSCLEDDAKKYKAGMRSPGTASFGIRFDPSVNSHTRLHELFKAGTNLKWAIGLSDGTDVPTEASGNWTLPTTRTFITVDGYISDFSFDFAMGALLESSVSIQTSGDATIHKKA